MKVGRLKKKMGTRLAHLHFYFWPLLQIRRRITLLHAVISISMGHGRCGKPIPNSHNMNTKFAGTTFTFIRTYIHTNIYIYVNGSHENNVNPLEEHAD